MTPYVKVIRPAPSITVLWKGSKEKTDGTWVTMHGSHVFIRDGQSAEEAAKERFGGKTSERTEQEAGPKMKWKDKLTSTEKDAVHEYLADWDTMRTDDRKGKENKTLNEFKSAVQKAPLVSGPVYRGFTVRTDEEMSQFKEGGTFKLNAISSFSEDSKIATIFAGMSAADHDRPFIVMECKNSKTIKSIKDFGIGESFEKSSKRDKEAIGFKGTRYKITKVEPTSTYNESRRRTVTGIKVVVEEL